MSKIGTILFKGSYDGSSKPIKASDNGEWNGKVFYTEKSYNSENVEIFCTDWLQPSIITNEYHAGSLIRLKKTKIKHNNDDPNIYYQSMMSWITAKIEDYGSAVAENASLHLANFIFNIEIAYDSLSTEERGKIINGKLAELAASAAKKKSSEMDDKVILPKTAPGKYVPRNSGRASDFLKSQWGQYIEAGVMFRPDLKRLDPKLEMALRNEFRGRPDELRALLPNRTDAADARLAAEFGAPVHPKDRKAAMTARSVAKRMKAPSV